MNVLFLCGRFGIGGVERVTKTLADALSSRGHWVGVIAFEFADRTMLKGLPVPTYVCASRTSLRRVLVENRIDVVVNQWALPASVSWMTRRASKGLNVKLIEVQHNAPDKNNRMLKSRTSFVRWVWKMLAKVSLRLVYRMCDRYVFLTPSIENSFFEFTGIRNRSKSVVIPNPVAGTEGALPDLAAKENLVLFVGRLSEPEKRPSRVIDVWRNIFDKLPDWKLEIVGDGPDAAALRAKAVGLPRVTFEGFQDPDEYYRRAKLLLQTSEYEGFGLVLIEAMARGCVPIAHGGCVAARDLIDGQNGVLTSGPWDAAKFATAALELARNDDLQTEMAQAGRIYSQRFTAPSVVERYEKMMMDVCHDR